jgi:hypothetical protein
MSDHQTKNKTKHEKTKGFNMTTACNTTTAPPAKVALPPQQNQAPKVLAQSGGENWRLFRGDSCEVTRGIKSDSIDYTLFSPPFSQLYVFSNSDRDLSNSKSDEEFFEHFGYLIAQLYRITKPGRLVSCHCMNMPSTKQWQGYIGIRDFRGDIIRAFEKEKFIYHSEVAIWKNPVVAMTRTKALGLLHKQLVKDSSMSRQGIADYIVSFLKPIVAEAEAEAGGETQLQNAPSPAPATSTTSPIDTDPEGDACSLLLRLWSLIMPDNIVTFRKPGVNAAPIAGRLDHFAGDKTTFRQQADLSIDIWQRYASPVWMDIQQGNTLQYRMARANADERHISALQLDVIERCIQLWSNPGDVVFSPFAGIGSECFQAVLMGRKALGIELKEPYFKWACDYMRKAEEMKREADRKLFD